MDPLVFSPSQQEGNQYAGGGTGYTDSEEFWMRKIAAEAKVLWDAQKTGIPCIVVNKGSFSANAAESDRLNAGAHVAIHSDAGGGHGTTVFHHTNSPKGATLAKSVYPFISAASNMPDRGIKPTTALGELNTTDAPAILIEVAYHDNTTEAAEIRASIHEYALAIVKGCLRYYGKTYKEPVAAVAAPVQYIEFTLHARLEDVPTLTKVAKDMGKAAQYVRAEKTSITAWKGIRVN